MKTRSPYVTVQEFAVMVRGYMGDLQAAGAEDTRTELIRQIAEKFIRNNRASWKVKFVSGN